MKKLRRMLAMLLTAAMLASASGVAYADDDISEVLPAAEEGTGQSGSSDLDFPQLTEEEISLNEKNSLTEEKDMEEKDTEKEKAESVSEEEVAYNLGKVEITVGTDEQKAEEDPWLYQLFDDDGNFEIPLEEDAFFPYEVQFTYDGKTVEEWFETPESEIEIGGHIFSVVSEAYDENAITQIGVWIGDEYIAAKPEEKEFSNSLISPFSLLDLTKKNLTLDLAGKTPQEISQMAISVILSGATPAPDATDKAVWIGSSASTPRILEQNEKVNLLELIGNTYSPQFELVVGNGMQLGADNIRYIIKIENLDTSSPWDESGFKICKDTNGSRSEITPVEVDNNLYGEETNLYIYIKKEDVTEGEYYIGGLQLTGSYAGQQCKIYQGEFDSAEEARQAATSKPEIDVTDKLINQSMAATGEGLKIPFGINKTYFNENYTVVFSDGTTDYLQGLYIAIGARNSHISGYIYEGWSNISEGVYVKPVSSIESVTVLLNRGKSADDPYALELEYYGKNGKRDNSLVDKAVEGHFDSLEAAIDKPDIKADLFALAGGNDGFSGVYKSPGKSFTVFAEGQVFRFTVIAQTDPNPEPMPEPGISDTYFRVNGATELSNCYVMPAVHDTYYASGFQTILYTDDVSPSSLKPTFSTDNGANIYAGHLGEAGTPQTSGATTADFSDGRAVQYSAAANGKKLKNYWVSFIPKHTGGAKLFVNGINGSDGAKREVFLTGINSYSRFHDIFIANVGDAPLTGLTATLAGGNNSTDNNIKLDDYWTVGGDGGNTLAPFTAVQGTNDTKNLNNIAKIRILPNGEGEINDTLIISADGQEPIRIQLTGNAGDPRLTTASIPEAVKYVPYAVQILHNNKYPWNTVTMSIVSGSLPEGVTLKPNGELYGVPKETGTFTFTIQMTNSDSRFFDDSQTYTLIVKENTNENVDGATDGSYEVTKRVGEKVGTDDVVTEIRDYEFISNGEFSEFIDFWMNGEKLTEGTDYTKEPGSTKITIRSQTFQNKAKAGEANTIAAEFRVNHDVNKDLRRSAQNFILKPNGSTDPSNPGGGSGNGGSSSSGGKKPGTSQSGQNGQTTVPKQPIIKAPETIIETLEVPVTKGDNGATATAEAEKMQQALANAQERTKDAPAGSPIQIVLKATGLENDIASMKITVPEAAIDAYSKNKDVSLKIDAGFLGEAGLQHAALGSLANVGKGDANISLSRSGNQIQLEMNKGDKRVDRLDGGIKIAFGGMDDGEVLVLIKTNGAEEIVKKSVVENGIAFALIEGSGTVKVIYNSKEFEDVSANDWFHDAVVFVNSRELFVGINETEFAPKMPMSRAMMAAVLHRLEDNADAGTESKFKDVEPEKWYCSDIAWAEAAGIISGYDTDTFGVNDNISREQMAGIMFRYAKYIGLDTVERGDITPFVDVAQISGWANESVRWAVGTGLLKGDGQAFRPQGDATRAEVAAIIMRFIEKIVK